MFRKVPFCWEISTHISAYPPLIALKVLPPFSYATDLRCEWYAWTQAAPRSNSPTWARAAAENRLYSQEQSFSVHVAFSLKRIRRTCHPSSWEGHSCWSSLWQSIYFSEAKLPEEGGSHMIDSRWMFDRWYDALRYPRNDRKQKFRTRLQAWKWIPLTVVALRVLQNPKYMSI